MGDSVDFERTDRPWTAQPPPVPNDNPSVHLVAAHYLEGYSGLDLANEMRERGEYGFRKYQQRLQAGNGRNWKADLFEELMDAMVYAYQGYLEGDKDGGPIFRALALRAEALLEDLRSARAQM